METTMIESGQARFRPGVYPQATVEKFRQTLVRMRDLACAELGGLAELIPEESRYMLGTGGLIEMDGRPLPRAEMAAAEAEQERLMAYLDALERALERIEGGSYGRCSVCGSVIGEDRLAGLPCAEQCAQCQARQLQTSQDA